MQIAACVFLQPIKIGASSYDEDLEQTELSNQRFQPRLHSPREVLSSEQFHLGPLVNARSRNSRTRGTPCRHRGVLLSRGACHLSDREDKAATSRNYDGRSEEECVGEPRNLLTHIRFKEQNKCDERTVPYCQGPFSSDMRTPT